MQEEIEKFSALLSRFNRVHNLTNFSHIDEQIRDSLLPLTLFDGLFKRAKKAIDIGSGGGFPAVFLALKTPHISWILCEPNSKKAAFLTAVKCSLGLDNVAVFNDKIQNHQPFEADLITSRGVGKVDLLLRLSRGFYTPKTAFLLYKGSETPNEIAQTEFEFSSEVKLGEGFRQYLLLTQVKEGKC